MHSYSSSCRIDNQFQKIRRSTFQQIEDISIIILQKWDPGAKGGTQDPRVVP